jgi:PPM family protein phosphatase
MDPINDDTVTELPAINERCHTAFFAEGEPPPSVSVGGATHTGLVRIENQDHFLIARRQRRSEVLLTSLPPADLPADREEAHLLLVADGIGGGEFGEVASRLVVSKVWELSGRATSWLMKIPDERSREPYLRMQRYVERLQQAFADAQSRGMLTGKSGTTCTCAYVAGWHAVVANIGDSRAYLARDGKLRQLTRDHTVAQQLIDLGLPRRLASEFDHMLTNCLGTDCENVHVELNFVRLRSGDRLLVCSDGLTNELGDEAIAAELGRAASPQEQCDRLLQLALDAGGHDNITLAVASLNPT